MNEITYNGDCDVIRNKNFQWMEFDDKELIINKKYEVITSCCMQAVYIKKDNEIVRDVSGVRYLYWKIKNEFGDEIYVWEGFFKENTNL